jgi:hypothetical protein
MLISFAPVDTGSSLVVERLWTKFTLVVRSKYFFRFFFHPIYLHGKLAYFFSIFRFFLALSSKLFLEVVFSGIIEDDGCFIKEFLLPVTEEVGLNTVFSSDCVDIFLALESLKYQ